jgi:hypothetical protein
LIEKPDVLSLQNAGDFLTEASDVDRQKLLEQYTQVPPPSTSKTAADLPVFLRNLGSCRSRRSRACSNAFVVEISIADSSGIMNNGECGLRERDTDAFQRLSSIATRRRTTQRAPSKHENSTAFSRSLKISALVAAVTALSFAVHSILRTLSSIARQITHCSKA